MLRFLHSVMLHSSIVLFSLLAEAKNSDDDNLIVETGN